MVSLEVDLETRAWEQVVYLGEVIPGSPSKRVRKQNRGERKASEEGVGTWDFILQETPERLRICMDCAVRGEGLAALSTHPCHTLALWAVQQGSAGPSRELP